jgi:hypothetical protein
VQQACKRSKVTVYVMHEKQQLASTPLVASSMRAWLVE